MTLSYFENFPPLFVLFLLSLPSYIFLIHLMSLSKKSVIHHVLVNDITKIADQDLMSRGSMTKQMLADALIAACAQLENQNYVGNTIDFEMMLEKNRP